MNVNTMSQSEGLTDHSQNGLTAPRALEKIARERPTGDLTSSVVHFVRALEGVDIIIPYG
jgi:hypothetical protein